MSRYLDQKTAKGPFRFESSCHLLLPVEVEAISLSALPRTQQANLPAYFFTLSLFMLKVTTS